MSVSKKFPCKTPQKEDRAALKNIVDPFLTWHSSVFNSCYKEIKEFSDSKLVEESFSCDGSFEVNEETMYNILSADIQGYSKIQSLSAFEILPTIPGSIAKRLKNFNSSISNLPELESSFDSDCIDQSGLAENNSTLVSPKKCSFSEDFTDTETICKNLKHLKIMNEFMNNSEEYMKFKKVKKN